MAELNAAPSAGKAPGTDTGMAPGTGTGMAPGTDTGMATGTDTGMAPGTGTGMAPGTDTGTATGTGTGMATGTGTGMAPGTGTGTAPGTAPGTVPACIAEPRDVDVLSLLRLRDRMKEQLEEYNSAVLANQENFIDQLKINAIEENLVASATKDLQRSIEEVKVSFQNKTLALQRIQIMDALRNKLKQDDEDSRMILETMKEIGLLSRTIIEYQQQVDQKEQQMTDMRRKRLSLKVDERQKLQQIQTVMKRQKKKQESVNVTRRANRLKKLEKERQITAIIQNVFQNIIIGSRVNWAKDPSLKAIVLQLEKSSYLQ